MGNSKTLRYFGRREANTPLTDEALPDSIPDSNTGRDLAVPVAVDLEGKRLAMERIRTQPFVSDATEPIYAAVQRWIEECGRQVTLPINFCGGLVIMRFYRLVAPASEQTPAWMSAVYNVAAAYDFAFLALGHADDEADMTFFRDGKPTRFVAFPDTRAVDGINLLLAGETAMQAALRTWPRSVADHEGAWSTGRHPLSTEIMEELIQALREASFPILLDRAGTGHSSTDKMVSSGLTTIQIDTESLQRIEAFTRHRAHTYFMRAIGLATLMAGFTDIDPKLMAVLNELFRLWGSMGAATDDLQDIFLDFATGIHSVCSVMAHLCVAEETELRPRCRRHLPASLLRDQRHRLAEFFGVTDAKLDRAALIAFLNEIELRRALEEHFESQATLFVATMGEAILDFGFSAEPMIEMAAVVCRDPELSVPEIYLSSLNNIQDDEAREVMNGRAGRFIAQGLLERFWPQSPGTSA